MDYLVILATYLLCVVYVVIFTKSKFIWDSFSRMKYFLGEKFGELGLTIHDLVLLIFVVLFLIASFVVAVGGLLLLGEIFKYFFV